MLLLLLFIPQTERGRPRKTLGLVKALEKKVKKKKVKKGARKAEEGKNNSLFSAAASSFRHTLPRIKIPLVVCIK